jgi:hypothetical protein
MIKRWMFGVALAAFPAVIACVGAPPSPEEEAAQSVEQPVSAQCTETVTCSGGSVSCTASVDGGADGGNVLCNSMSNMKYCDDPGGTIYICCSWGGAPISCTGTANECSKQCNAGTSSSGGSGGRSGSGSSGGTGDAGDGGSSAQ